MGVSAVIMKAGLSSREAALQIGNECRRQLLRTIGGSKRGGSKRGGSERGVSREKMQTIRTATFREMSTRHRHICMYVIRALCSFFLRQA